MKKELQITTRELLREFKNYKELLLSRTIESIHIPVDTNSILELKMKSEKNSAGNILKSLKNLPEIKIERTTIFDEMFDD